MDKQQLLTGQTLNIIINTKTGAKAPTTKGKKMKAYKIKLEVRIMLTDKQAEELKNFNMFDYDLSEQITFLQKHKANISQSGSMECEGKAISLTTIGMSGGYMGEKLFNQKYGR
jgi:hypothetical protein